MSAASAPGSRLDLDRTATGVVVSQLPRLGRYELVARLAVGGMAEVYLARHGELAGFKTLVVLKKVLPHLAENPEFISMFLDEARIATLLDHPNVVRTIEVGCANDDHFLAMELVQGKPLSSLLRKTSERGALLDPKLVALIMSHVAAGLHHAHDAHDVTGHPLGVVHRDISPKNIMISFEGSVKVIDFGIARARGRLCETATSGMKGTIGYMAPEQVSNKMVDHRADIFAAGVVLWETLCGRRLFKRQTEMESLRALMEDPVPRPSSLAAVPAAMDRIVMKAVARDANERFQTARELSAALENYLAEYGGANNSDLSTLMKAEFATDHADWKNLIRAAHEMVDRGAPLVSPIKMTVSTMGVLSNEPVGPPAAAPIAKPPKMLKAVLAACAVLVVGLTVAFLPRQHKPDPTPVAAKRPAIIDIVSPPAAPAPPMPVAQVASSEKSVRKPTAPKRSKPRPAREALLKHRPNPFE